MDIHVILDGLPGRLSPRDLYIVFEKQDEQRLLKAGCTQVVYREILLDDPEQVYAQATRDFFLQLPEELEIVQNDVFSRMFFPILLVTDVVACQAERVKPACIHLYGGSTGYYLAAEHSESESGGRWLYSRGCMFNPVVYRVLKDRFSIRWHGRYFRAATDCLFALRCAWLSGKILLKSRLECVKKRPKLTLPQVQDRKYVLVSVWVKQQLGHLEKFFEKSRLYKPVYLSELSLKTEGAVKVSALTAGQWSGYYSHCRSVLRKVRRAQLTVSGEKLEIPAWYIRQSLKRTFLQSQYHRKRLELTALELSGQTKFHALVNNKTWNWTQAMDKSVSQELGIPLHTLQYVTLPQVVYPNKKVFDKLYLTSKSLAQLLAGAGIDCCVYSGYPVCKVKSIPAGTKKLSVFLQPEMFDEVSIRLICDMAARAEAFSAAEVVVKPHYRQSEEVIDRIRQVIQGKTNFRLAEKSESATEIILSSDLVVSFASSVLFEAACYGVLPIAMHMIPRVDELATRMEMFTSGCVVSCRDVEALLSVLAQPEETLHTFENSRTAYLENELGGEKNLDTIL